MEKDKYSVKDIAEGVFQVLWECSGDMISTVFWYDENFYKVGISTKNGQRFFISVHEIRKSQLTEG